MNNMRVCDFLRHLSGDMLIRIYTSKDIYGIRDWVVIKEASLEDMNAECNNSFNIFYGFNNELWNKEVKAWHIEEKIACIKV